MLLYWCYYIDKS